MENKEIIKKYLREKLSKEKTEKTRECPNEEALLNYVTNSLGQQKRKNLESHLAGCGSCLNQINLASEALRGKKQKSLKPVPKEIIDKTRAHLGISKTKIKPINKKKNLKTKLYLTGTIIFFVLSFLVPQYFIQFLIGALILGIRWSFESKGGQTLIMVLDSWRKHSHDKDEQISNRLKDHFKNKKN